MQPNEVSANDLNQCQKNAFDQLIRFVTNPDEKVFILKGYAGTGKTTLMRVLIDEMRRRLIPFRLLASTGRAAKILSNATGVSANTVHSEIYSFSGLSEDLDKISEEELPEMDESGQLYLQFKLTPSALDEPETSCYIVDEASMISDVADQVITQAAFGSGKLLTDLLTYDTSSKFIFVGDACQLPPVVQPFSPAMDASYFKNEFGIDAKEAELTQVMRQSGDSDIRFCAQEIRHLYQFPQPWKWARYPLSGYKSIHILDSVPTLLDEYISRAKRLGFTAATLITSSNRQANTLSRALRVAFGHLGPNVEKGDLLLVTQNNLITGLMNGDLVTVESVSFESRRAGLTFLNVSVRELFSERTYQQLMIAEPLYNGMTNLTTDQHKSLFIDFHRRMKKMGIKYMSDAYLEMLRNDPYLNALRAVYGYALTCHKAQGGEWDYVYLDIQRFIPGKPKPYSYQWVYTAVTRACKELYIVNDFWVA